METETDITFEELKAKAAECSEGIKRYINNKMKEKGLMSLPIACDIPRGISLLDSLKDMPNRQMANLMAGINNCILDAWYIIIEDYGKKPINQVKTCGTFGIDKDQVSNQSF